MNHKQQMIKLLKEISSKHSLWNVFSDFLELSAISIANACEFTQAREDKYMAIIKKYNKKEAVKFAYILAELTMALEEKTTDVLGEIFMELELSNKWKGQFFTPFSLAKLMSDLTFSNIDKNLLQERGYITVNEPAAGGGANIIAFAMTLQEKGFNYQKNMLVYAMDIDIKSVYMTYIQLSLLGIPAVITHGNTLTLETYENWKTPFYILNNWERRMKIVNQNIDKRV